MDWMSHAMDWMGRSSPALYALSSESPTYPSRLRIRVQPTRMRAGPMSAVCDSETASVPRVASMLGCPLHALRTEKAADVRTRMSGLGCQDSDVRTRMSGLGCQDSDVKTRPRPSGDSDTARYRAHYPSSMLRIFVLSKPPTTALVSGLAPGPRDADAETRTLRAVG